MILTSKKRISAALFALCLVWTLLVPFFARAQNNSVSLSVTPTLFEMIALPQQTWTSSVKAINNNRFPLTVYASVVNFAPEGETGQGKFLPVFDEVTEGATLAEWIEISSEPQTLAPGESRQIPFTVRVPEDASPGGHFAAIMIGTRPPDPKESFQIKTSQIVTSLFFVRVAGDVIEDGVVREFRTTEQFVSTPEANFEVRFENKGNVHILPQGEITIKNMWGKERGIIPINHQTHFGNVLPNSIRKFEFAWKGEFDFSDIGRYSAELSLAYGTDSRKFVTSKTYFWVIPVKSVLTVLAVIIGIIAFVMWAVKAYVRRMLALDGYEMPTRGSRGFKRAGDVLIERRSAIDTPVRAGWLDLRTRLARAGALVDRMKTIGSFVWSYRLFFGALTLSCALAGTIWYFLSSVLTDSRDYEVTITNPDSEATLSSEEILYNREQSADETESGNLEPAATTTAQNFTLTIVNSSDTTGAAAALGKVLEQDYEIAALRSDFSEAKERSVIVYHPDLQAEALALRAKVGDFILSALPPEEEERSITIYIGNDYEVE